MSGVPATLTECVDEECPPFSAEVPNAATRRAMKELEDGKGHRSEPVEALFEDLGF